MNSSGQVTSYTFSLFSFSFLSIKCSTSYFIPIILWGAINLLPVIRIPGFDQRFYPRLENITHLNPGLGKRQDVLKRL